MQKKTLWDLIKLAFPMGRAKRNAMAQAAPYLDPVDYKQLKYYLKLDRAFVTTQKFDTTIEAFPKKEWSQFKTHREGDTEKTDLKKFLDSINNNIAAKAKEQAFLEFAPHAIDTLAEQIAPNIIGMDAPKQAAVAQLFANDPMHLLLLGDPGTGKTDILRGLSKIAPISSMGLGSGTSGAGLSAMAKGDTLILGLLPLANEGIACIDELNLMKSKDSAALYNAMEKGFVTYDKGGKHEQLPAKVRVCATANPQGDTFIGKSAESLRNQVPFDDALLSRFHIIFIIRKPTGEEFEKITSHIVQHHTGTGAKGMTAGDIDFVKQYVTYAQKIDVQIDSALEGKIVAFIKGLKADERKFISEVGPRTVVGVLRIVKAVARAELSQAVDDDHLKRGFDLMRESLYIRKPDEVSAKNTAAKNVATINKDDSKNSDNSKNKPLLKTSGVKNTPGPRDKKLDEEKIIEKDDENSGVKL